MKSMNKKILVSLSVLATPFVVESFTDNIAQASAQYTLNTDVKTYKTANDAVSGTAAHSTYVKGNYYIYKKVNGMINISNTPGKAGAWINPITNQVVSAPINSVKTIQAKPVESSTRISTATYTVSNPTRVYENSANASKRVGATSTYQKGIYHIYKNYNGMLNISKKQGKAGAWINPAEARSSVTAITQQEKPVVKTTITTSKVAEPVTSQSNQYILSRKVKTYANAANAKQGIGSNSTYNEGKYYIFRRSGDMLNISKVAGRAGAWINPAENLTSVVSAIAEPISAPTFNSYVLNNDVDTYSNAKDAASKSNARSNYKKGTYFIYKTVNGMYNITRIKEKAGAWINPTDNKIITSSIKLEENKKQGETSNLADSTVVPIKNNPVTLSTYETANKIYSVMTEFGLNKYQVAGMLGNFEAESNINPEIFEAYFRPTAKVDARQLADMDGPTVDNLFEGGWEQFKSDYAARGIELTEKGYDYTGTGVHWLGVGLGQWTGPSSKGLWEFSKDRGMSMWSVDTQLAYMLSKLPEDVSLYNRLVVFKEMSADSAVQGADNFSKEWERNVKNLATQKRRNEAEKWLTELNKMKVDVDYARTIMSKVIK